MERLELRTKILRIADFRLRIEFLPQITLITQIKFTIINEEVTRLRHGESLPDFFYKNLF